MRLWKRYDKVKVGEVIEIKVKLIEAEALHIKRTGSYILQLDRPMPMSEMHELLKRLRESTGAKWVILNAGCKVIEADK